MNEAQEPSYYEIALTNRQVLTAFVVILVSVLGAFLSGVWVGRKNPPLPSAEMQLARAGEAGEPAGNLENLAFFSGDSSGRSEAGSAGPLADPPPATPRPDLSRLLSQPSADTTLAQDVGATATPDALAPETTASTENVPPASAPTSRPATTPPAPAPPDPAPAATPPDADGFVIQIFSTKDEPQARRVLRQLREAGFKAFLSPVAVDSQTMYRVRVGPFKERASAEQKARQIKERLRFETWITAASN